MSVEIKMQRKAGANVDFTAWNLELDDDLMPFANRILNDSLSVVFSETGANSRLYVDYLDRRADDIQIVCEIEINEFEAYASSKVSLKDLLEGYVRDTDDHNNVANSLRSIADYIDGQVSAFYLLGDVPEA